MIRIDPPPYAQSKELVVRFYVAHYGNEPYRVYKGFWFTGENSPDPSKVKELLFPFAPETGDVTVVRIESLGGFPILAHAFTSAYSPEGVLLGADWRELRKMKQLLCNIRDSVDGTELLEGLLNFLDALQDSAADVLQVPGVFEHEAIVA